MKFYRLFLFALCVSFLGAQEPAPQGRVFVNFVSASSVAVTPGHSTPIQFTFKVLDPYHINSSQPLAEELIPTQLHFSLPGEVALGKMQYPVGKMMSFPFDPSTKLSVYSGNFVVKGVVVAPAVASTGTYTIHGELRYQACDNNACYPPKKLPFTFDVKVGARGRKRA
jgi:hypothetical protein